MTSIDKMQLLQRAEAAAAQAYAPYSNQPKGAALLTADGSIYAAACVENAAWPAAVCAESGALAAAVADGHRDFTAMALLPFRFPCGTCLQMLREFTLAIELVTRDADGKIVSRSLEQLLPDSFGPSHLGR